MIWLRRAGRGTSKVYRKDYRKKSNKIIYLMKKLFIKIYKMKNKIPKDLNPSKIKNYICPV